MFHLIVAFALFLAVSPIRPALSLADLNPPSDPIPERHLSVSSERNDDLGAILAGPQPPFRRDPTRLGIETSSRAVAVVDWETGHILFEKNASVGLPIASITKLVTALAVLDLGTDWDQEVEIIKEDDRIGDLPLIYPGDIVTVRDLFSLSLIASSNDASIALARSTGLTPEQFAAKMNAVASKYGLTDHRFVEPTGLNQTNSASARDVARLARVALSNPAISQAVLSPSYEFTDLSDGGYNLVRNTDELLNSFLTKPPYSFMGGKTGYLPEAGYCFVAAAGNQEGNRVLAVVLGADSKAERFLEVKRLIWWAFDAWQWPEEESDNS